MRRSALLFPSLVYVCVAVGENELGDACSRAERACLNGGICLETAFVLSCICPAGTAGELCESASDIACINDGENPCLNGGVCVMTTNQITGVTQGACTCPDGFSGARCEGDGICELQCQHGASCRHDDDIAHDNSGASSFECECVGSYKGLECEVPFAVCPTIDSDKPAIECLWGGACAFDDDDDEYTCECPSGRSGSRCEKEDVVNSRPDRDEIINLLGPCRDDGDCNNGGLCVLSHDAENTAAIGKTTKRAQCLCSLGWGGDTCELPCTTLACQHGSSCLFAAEDVSHANDAPDHGAYCACDEHLFKGRECEIAVQKCPGPDGLECLYGGSCIAERYYRADIYSCACPRGRTGARCETADPGYHGSDQVAQTLTVTKEGIDPIVFIISVAGVALLVFLPLTVMIVKRSNKRNAEVLRFTTAGSDGKDTTRVSGEEGSESITFQDAQVV